jgi:hypothetical protein
MNRSVHRQHFTPAKRDRFAEALGVITTIGAFISFGIILAFRG